MADGRWQDQGRRSLPYSLKMVRACDIAVGDIIHGRWGLPNVHTEGRFDVLSKDDHTVQISMRQLSYPYADLPFGKPFGLDLCPDKIYYKEFPL